MLEHRAQFWLHSLCFGLGFERPPAQNWKLRLKAHTSLRIAFFRRISVFAQPQHVVHHAAPCPKHSCRSSSFHKACFCLTTMTFRGPPNTFLFEHYCAPFEGVLWLRSPKAVVLWVYVNAYLCLCQPNLHFAVTAQPKEASPRCHASRSSARSGQARPRTAATAPSDRRK